MCPAPNSWLHAQLSLWYRTHARVSHPQQDAYHVWVYEVILQQTRMRQGLPYYARFIKHFDCLSSLAKADEAEVFRLWEGLGYYRRAAHMHKTAQLLCSEHGGIFPTTAKELQKLPGIGAYTAAAIASISFGEPVPTIDGNVIRVLSRFLGCKKDPSKQATLQIFREYLLKRIDRQHPAIFNQALMDVGAKVCLPTRPHCAICPLRAHCVAYAQKTQHFFPIKKTPKALRERFFHYLIIDNRATFFPEGEGQQRKGAERGERVGARKKAVVERRDGGQNGLMWLLRRRVDKDIWQGLYDFYPIEHSKALLWSALRLRLPSYLSNATPHAVSSLRKHVLTHQRLFARFFHLSLSQSMLDCLCEEEKVYCWYSSAEIARLGKPIFLTKYLSEKKIISTLKS